MASPNHGPRAAGGGRRSGGGAQYVRRRGLGPRATRGATLRMRRLLTDSTELKTPIRRRGARATFAAGANTANALPAHCRGVEMSASHPMAHVARRRRPPARNAGCRRAGEAVSTRDAVSSSIRGRARIQLRATARDPRSSTGCWSTMIRSCSRAPVTRSRAGPTR